MGRHRPDSRSVLFPDEALMTDFLMLAKGSLMLIGGLWLGAKAVSFMRWRFVADRDGNSGRCARHWSHEI